MPRAGSANVSWLLPQTPLLARLAAKGDPEKPARRRDQGRGYKLRGESARGANHKTLMTDAQVLECRARYEFEAGWTPPRLARHYGTSIDYMRNLLAYQTRSKLVPKRP